MRHANILGGAFAVAAALLLAGPASAADWPDDCQEATLPSDDLRYPDAQLILTCLPPDFNGTLIVYAHGYVKPQEPLALPAEFGAAEVRELIEQLLSLGLASRRAATTRTAMPSNRRRPTSTTSSPTSSRSSRTSTQSSSSAARKAR
jgi:hypothetical protein